MDSNKMPGEAHQRDGAAELGPAEGNMEPGE